MAAANARASAGTLQPSLNLSYSGSRRKQNFVGFPIPGAEGRVLSTVFTNQGISLDTTWEIDLWRRLRVDAQATLAELQSAGADLRGAQLSLAGQTSKAWFAIAEAQQQVQLSETTVESFQESAELVQERYESGIRPALDLRLASLNLSNARALLDQRRQQLDASKRQLDVLLGRYASGAMDAPTELPVVPPAIPSGLPADLIARRPDLVAAERQVAAAEARQSVTGGLSIWLPNISLTAGTGTATDALKTLLSGDFTIWSLVGNVVAPLWEGGTLRAQIAMAEANTAEMLANYANTALTAYAEVETALAADKFFADRVQHLETSVEQARAAERLAEERYFTGLDNYIPVLDSQRSAVQAEGDLIAARRLRLENRVDLYLALGGGFEQLDASVTVGEVHASVTGP
jgi:NodT family efflux transporter outer membrane factor (OMF) lipoprotein